MSFNAAQEARRKLQPKTRRAGMAREASPNAHIIKGMEVPLFHQPGGGIGLAMPATESFAPPAATSFSFGGGAFQPAGVSNPFASFSNGVQAPNTNDDASKRNGEGEEEMARKKPFGGFSATTNSQTPTSNIFGGQQASTQNSKPLFGAASTGSMFANNGAPASPFPFNTSGTQAQTPSSNISVFSSLPGPSQPITSFSFSQPNPQDSNNKSPVFGNGAGFNFPSNAASTNTAPPPTQSTSASFTFGQSQTQTPVAGQTPAMSTSSSFPPNNTASIFSKPATPASTPLFGSTTPKATNEFKLGSQASSNFNIVPPKTTGNSLFGNTPQPTASTPAASSTPSTNLFPGFGSPAGPTKAASDTVPTAKSSSNGQTPKFTFGETAKTQENGASATPSSQSIFSNMAQKPMPSNFFGTPSTTTNQPTKPASSNMFNLGNSTSEDRSQSPSDSSNVFQAPKPSESTVGDASTQQTNGTNGLFSFGSKTSNEESSKGRSDQTPFTFTQPQPQQAPQVSQPEKSNNQEPARSSFMQSQPLQTAQASQPISNNLFGNLKPAQNQTEGNGDPKTSSSNNNGTPAAANDFGSSSSKPTSLFSNTYDSSKAANTFAKHKPVRPSPLSQSILGPTSPDVDRSANLSAFQSTSRTSADNTNGLNAVFGSPTKLSQQDAQKEAEKKEYDAAKRLRSLCNAVKSSISRMPVDADLSMILEFYETRRDQILKDVAKAKRKAVDDGTDEDGSGPGPSKRQRQNNGKAAATSTSTFVSTGESFKENEAPSRPTFESPSKPAPFMNGTTTPRGPPPTNIFAAQALMTPAPVFSKDPPQTEKPKSTTSLFSAATSTVPRKPTSKTTFEFSSQATQSSVAKTNGTSREPSPPKRAAPSNLQPSKTPLFGSSASAPSPTKQPAKPAPPTNLFGSSIKQPSTTSASSSSQQPPLSFAPPASTSAPASSPAPGGKRKADSQLTKDDFEAEETGVSTPGGKRKATSQLTKDDLEASEKAPSTPSGKRKAEAQLTKDDCELENGVGRDAQKTPKVNGTRSETSKIFKNIIDSPRQTNGTGQASPQKKMFSLNKSDNSTPRANPFASLGVSASPARATSPTPQKFAAPATSFGSPAPKGNGVSKSLFSLPKSDSSSSTSIFSASELSGKDSAAASAQPAFTNSLTFGNAQKSAASPFTASSSSTGLKAPSFGAAAPSPSTALKVPSFGAVAPSSSTGLKMPSFGAANNGVSAAEQFRKQAEEATEKAALRKAIEEDYDSEDDGDKATWIKKWKENRQKSKDEQQKKAKELSKQSKSVFIPGKGFSFSSQDDEPEEGSKADSTEPADSPRSPPKSPSEPLVASSTDASRATSLGPATSANESVFSGHMARKVFDAGNIFGNLSDKGNEADDESDDEVSEADVPDDDEKRDPTYDPAKEPEIETPDSPVDKTGPGIASAKKQASTPTLSQPPTPGASTSKGSLFDRIARDSDGNPIRQISPENKENTQPSSSFNFFAPSDQTWNKNSPIKFGTAAATSTTPSVNFTAAKPPASNLFNFSASTKAPATISGSTPAAAPMSNLFGTSTAATTQPKPFGSLFGSAAVSSCGSETPTPAATSGSSIFGSTKAPAFAGFGNSKPAAVGFTFGGASTSAASSLFPSAATSAENSRATTPGATTDNDSSAPTEASGDPDAEKHEQINLSNSRAGEEDEEVLFESRAKVFLFQANKFESKGTGPFRLLKHKETGATRTLLRADPSGNVVLNKGLLGNFNYAATIKTVRMLTASDDGKGLETWLVQVKSEDLAKDLAKVLEESKPKST